MAAQSGVTTSGGLPAHGGALPAVYADGIRAGLVGAATIALWFFALDAFAGRPLYTPTVLGTALFRGTGTLDSPDRLAIAPDLVIAFTAVHTLVFVLIGTGRASVRTPSIYPPGARALVTVAGRDGRSGEDLRVGPDGALRIAVRLGRDGPATARVGIRLSPQLGER